MLEGFWLDSRTGRSIQVHIDHCVSIYDPSCSVFFKFGSKFKNKIENLHWKRDREKILVEVMKKGFVRIRGHRSLVTFELFSSRPLSEFYPVVLKFLERYWVGIETSLKIANLKSKEIKMWRCGDFIGL